MSRIANWLILHSLDIAMVFAVIWVWNHHRSLVVNLCPITETTPPSINQLYHI